MSVQEHKSAAPTSVSCMVLTISDSRTQKTDKSGKLMIERLEQYSHVVTDYQIVIDEREKIISAIRHGINDLKVDAILLNGGTGIAQRDVTIESVQSVIEKEIPGFGELFRMLSFNEDIGTAAILSRAIAGTCGKTVIFSTPGSSGAVKLALNCLILPELNHIVRELNK